MDIDLGRSRGDASEDGTSREQGGADGDGPGLRDRLFGGSTRESASSTTESAGGRPATGDDRASGAGSASESAALAGAGERVDRLRRRVDPRETAESAARALVRLSLRVVGAILIAYAAWLFVVVDGWTRLAAASAAAGFLPAFAPGFVVGVAGLVWKLFSIA
jgi:hypothetical protein